VRSRITAASIALVLVAAVPCALLQAADGRAAVTRQGIDVSAYQGSSIAWHSVAASGISFAYIRAGDGAASPDGQFARNWRGASAAGVTPGAYLFFEPNQSPVAQADLLISQLRSVGFARGDLVPTIDVETTDGEPQAVVVANLRTVVNIVSAAIGSLPAIYCSPSWWSGNINSAAFTLDPLWVANWFVSQPQVPENNWGGTGWQVWQYSDAGVVPGIPGRVDLDRGGVRSLPYYGFPDPHALPQAANVAGTPQTVSDQAGDINVLWRGTNNHLWSLGFRNGTWGSVSTDISAAGGTVATLLSDPSVVSAGAGQIDAFWKGEDGHLWQTRFTGGWFGSGTWSAPAALGVGVIGSGPRAVSPAPGLIDLFWKGSDGSLWVARDNRGWSGATPLNTGAVGGNPVAASAGQGSDTVFWRDASGGLWADTGASWGWSGARRLSSGALSADPSVSAAGTSIDVFWNSAGQLWHGALSSGSWSGAAALGTETVAGNPAVVDLAPGSVIVNAREPSGLMASSLYTSASGLVGPEGLGATAYSDPSSVAFAGGGAIDVVWRSSSNTLWVAPACPGCSAPAIPVFSPAG
jgi:GH25 family lysozyme M1 (1,4-beta-N-acetylmuramidase)